MQLLTKVTLRTFYVSTILTVPFLSLCKLFSRYKAEEQKTAVKEVESTVNEHCTVHLCQKKYVGTHILSQQFQQFLL
jgi:hypothetical protein